MKDEAELQFQIDLLESFDADSDEQLNAQMIVWLKELQHRRAAMLKGAACKPALHVAYPGI